MKKGAEDAKEGLETLMRRYVESSTDIKEAWNHGGGRKRGWEAGDVKEGRRSGGREYIHCIGTAKFVFAIVFVGQFGG